MTFAGKGGTYYGPYYKGPITVNAFNTSQRTPGNAAANDPAARKRLYDETTKIVEEVAANLQDSTAATQAAGTAASTMTGRLAAE